MQPQNQNKQPLPPFQSLTWQPPHVRNDINLRYSQKNHPPHIVMLKYVSKHGTNANLGRYSPIAMATKIRSITPNRLTISPNGINSVKIVCDEFIDANKILDFFDNPHLNYQPSVPIALFRKKGFINPIETNIPLETIYNEMDNISKQNIISLKRRVDNENNPNQSVEIVFNTTIVSKNVKIYNYLFPVIPIIPLPKRYFFCQRYRHTADKCCSVKPICEFCSQRHQTPECTNLLNQPKCNNCRQAHIASSKDCPKYTFEFNVSKICYNKNIGYQEAAQTLVSQGLEAPPTPTESNLSMIDNISQPILSSMQNWIKMTNNKLYIPNTH